MAARDINARIAEVEGERELLEKKLLREPGLDPAEQQSLAKECRSLGQLERRLANERLRSVEPRESVAMSRAREKGSGAQLRRQRWETAFGEKATMVQELHDCSLGEMKSVLDAFIRVHKAAGDAETKGGLILLELCQRVIMAVLNEMKPIAEGGLPRTRNMDWVLAQLQSVMDDVATFVESFVHERPTALRRVLYKLGVVTEDPPALFDSLEVTLRGILAVLQSRDSLPNLPTVGSAAPIPEERQDSPALPLPWDAYEVAQSLHDFAEQLGHQEQLPSQDNLSDIQAGEALCRQAVRIWEHFLWRSHPQLAQGYATLGGLIEHQGKYRYAEADSLYADATEIIERTLGPDHPTMASLLNSRAALLVKQGKYDDAELLYERATKIWENALGPDHPRVATVLTDRAELLHSQVGQKMDPIGLVQGALASLQKARDASQGVTDLKTTLRRRYGDYFSVLEPLRDKPDVITANEIEPELRRLTELFTIVANLIGEYTAAPADSKLMKFYFKVKTAQIHVKELDEIDRKVMRQLAIMNLKGAISSSEMEVLQGAACPPVLPDMAAVPAGAPSLPNSFVKRPYVEEVIDGLINPGKALTPYTIAGMGGGGKTVVASAVVREQSVRKHFRGGIFWIRVGRRGNNSLLPLLRGLAREMGASTDATHGVPHGLDSLERVKLDLAAVASTSTSPRLVVLDDVWQREVVDALVPLGLRVLVTTRDRSVIGVSEARLELGDMTDEEALELLRKRSLAVAQPGSDVQAQMIKVVALCGRLPLVLAIAGSMPVVKGQGLSPGAWKKLIEVLEDVNKKMRARGEQWMSINTVLETSFDALTRRTQDFFLKMAVLAAGIVAPKEMLLNLWEMKDLEDTQDAAEHLVSKYLLQGIEGGGYRVADLVLEFVKIKIKADIRMVRKATALQALYLGRLDVVKSYADPKHGTGSQGLFFLDALWRSVEELSGDPALEVTSYRASLGELESCEATAEVAGSFASVGFFFKLQGKYAEAEALYSRCQAIEEKVLGPEHPSVATTLNHLAGLLEIQYVEAEPLYLRAIEIGENALGPDHPDIATMLNNRALLLAKQGKFEEAGPLYERSLAIREEVLGPEHPDVAQSLDNWALLLSAQEKYAEAIPLLERALSIRTKKLGQYHPDTVSSQNSLEAVRKKV